jgi:rare lipoprotein A
MKHILLLLALVTPLKAYADCGKASWYGKNHNGKIMANGKPFSSKKLTAASNTLRLGTKIKVTYKKKSVVVTITDRGGFSKYGRILDLSKAAADKLGFTKKGVATVCFYKI